ncbi:MAG: hypothetical protein AB7F59_04770 [Bdellovibrionales bacterium]
MLHKTLNERTLCPHEQICSGCSQLHVPYSQQIQVKQELLLSKLRLLGFSEKTLSKLQILTPGSSGLRDRVDYILDQSQGARKLGLLNKPQPGSFEREIVDLETCPQLSPQLQSWMQDFRAVSWDIQKGSLRLRVGPQGQRGVWLDFSNVDIKKLLEEPNGSLNQLLKQAKVEMGQKRKSVRWVVQDSGEKKLKLTDPEPEVWFETYNSQGEPLPLFSYIGSFTQPGFEANRTMLTWLHQELAQIQPTGTLELGAGIGNFTFALAEYGNVFAIESEGLALECLQKTLSHLPALYKERIHTQKLQFHQIPKESLQSFDLWLADPPRSGLQSLLGELPQAILPRNFIYISCYLESFAHDLKKLKDMGYELSSIALLDQFPQSDHFEILASLKLNTSNCSNG